MSPKFPRTPINPTYIWTYPTRTITELKGQPRIDLMGEDSDIETGSGTRKKLIDRIETLEQYVWEYPTRTMTEFKGQPRIDLMGEDSDIESGTGTRKTIIDELEKIGNTYEGTIRTDGTEQTVIEETDTKEFRLEGYIDLSELRDDEELIIRQYIKIKDTGEYKLQAEKTYKDQQRIPLLYILTKPSKHGIKITIQRTAGAQRNHDYQFFKRERSR